MKGSAHHPYTVTGREKMRRTGDGSEPRQTPGWSDRWTDQGRSGACTRQQPKPVHPQCRTTKPVAGLIGQWMVRGDSLDLVRTRLQDPDVIVAAAAYQFIKLKEK